MERKGKDKDLHDDMVNGMIKKLNEKGVTVLQADINGYDKPDEINGCIPDIVGIKKDKTKVVVEVETCESVDIDHTQKQFKAFSSADGEFWVDCPESCLGELKRNAKSWGVTVDHWYKREGE